MRLVRTRLRELRCSLSASIIFALACTNVSAEVEIEGLDGELLANALAHLTIDDEGCNVPLSQVKRLLKQGNRELRAAAEALGYYDIQIESRLIEETDCWRATFVVDAGEPVLVRDFSFELKGAAADDVQFQKRLSEPDIQTGLPFRHDRYEALKRLLLELAARRGYADATLSKSQVSVFPEQLAADIELEFDSGPRYNFGEVRFDQNVLDPELVRLFVPFRRGEPYDGRRLTDLYADLSASGFFEFIQAEPMLESRSNGEIPIAVTLTPGKTKVYGVGAGFSTDTGPRGRASYTNRRINDRGHQWGASMLLSKVDSELTANYRLPFDNPRSEWLSFDAGFKRENTDTSKSDTYQIGTRLVVDRDNEWQENRFISLLVEDFEISDLRDTSKLLVPGISWLRVQAENRLRPIRGSRLFFQFRGSSDVLVSDSSFLQFTTAAKWVRQLWSSARVIARGEFGATLVDRFDDLPPSIRFFVGGDSSVRGYDYEVLGPVDESGAVIGGKNKLVGSIEFEQEMWPKNSIAFFVDSGNAADDFDFDLSTGAGIGYRWQSPIGPLRIDLAKPLDGLDRSIRLHVSFGPDL